MILNDRDKLIYEKEIPEAGALRTFDIEHLNFDLDKGYIVKYYLTMPRLSGEDVRVYLRPEGVQNAFNALRYGRKDASGASASWIADDLSTQTYIDLISAEQEGSSYPSGANGEFTITKHPDSAARFLIKHEAMRWNGVHRYDVNYSGFVQSNILEEITYLDLYADGSGSGTPTWFGDLKVYKV